MNKTSASSRAPSLTRSYSSHTATNILFLSLVTTPRSLLQAKRTRCNILCFILYITARNSQRRAPYGDSVVFGDLSVPTNHLPPTIQSFHIDGCRSNREGGKAESYPESHGEYRTFDGELFHFTLSPYVGRVGGQSFAPVTYKSIQNIVYFAALTFRISRRACHLRGAGRDIR